LILFHTLLHYYTFLNIITAVFDHIQHLHSKKSKGNSTTEGLDMEVVVANTKEAMRDKFNGMHAKLLSELKQHKEAHTKITAKHELLQRNHKHLTQRARAAGI
jgi:hypothetical protein